jgi:hypothetical protein
MRNLNCSTRSFHYCDFESLTGFSIHLLRNEIYRSSKDKGKVPLCGLYSALKPYRLIVLLTPKEFLHSSLEALHAKQRERPQLAKERTIVGI